MASIVVAGDTSGTVTLAAPAVSGTTTLTLPTTSGTIVTTSGAQTIEFADGSASTPSITNSGDTNTGIFFPAADTIAFAEGGTESMRIDSSGNLIVGDTVQSGSSKLTLKQSVDATNGGLAFVATDGNGAVISRLTDGGFTFRNGGVERMRIDTQGNVGIGTSSQDTRLVVSASTGTAVQRIYNTSATNTYQMSFHNNAQECGTITTGNNTVGYNSNSDYRLKDNVIPMTGALDKIAKLKPVTYIWKASGTNGQGFIAHELQEHFPDAVSGEKDAVNEDGKPVYQGVDTSFLVATLTAAIQEQQTIIETLKADIAELKAKVNN